MTAADATTLLFVPGNRPDRFDKAVAAGAELVVLDLEDAVGPADKDAARRHVVAWLADGHHAAVRINAAGTPAHEVDVAALARFRVPVMVPKASRPEALAQLGRRLHPETVLMALVETAAGALSAPALAAADGVVRLVLGSFDLAAELGVSPDDREALAGARHALVLASAAAGLAGPVDGVTGDVRDADALRADLAHGVRLGFRGKLCVHPDQVAAARAAFVPGEAEVAWARRVLEAVEAGGDVVLVDGAMVDRPVVDRARRILSRSDAGDQTQ